MSSLFNNVYWKFRHWLKWHRWNRPLPYTEDQLEAYLKANTKPGKFRQEYQQIPHTPVLCESCKTELTNNEFRKCELCRYPMLCGGCVKIWKQEDLY